MIWLFDRPRTLRRTGTMKGVKYENLFLSRWNGRIDIDRRSRQRPKLSVVFDLYRLYGRQ